MRDWSNKLGACGPQVSFINACRGCGGGHLTDFLHYDNLPVAGTYLSESDLGHEPLLPLSVAFCNECRLVQLRETLPSSVYHTYRFLGTGSAGYRAYLEGVADSLVTHFGVRRKRVLEIGCSNGFLLNLLRKKGDNQVFGYEPSRQLARICQEDGIAVSTAFFSSAALKECAILPVDVMIIRHVLEHIHDLHDFLTGVTAALAKGPDSLLLIEVPDVMTILTKGLYFHFYHEHLGYFSLNSLRRLLRPYRLEIMEQRLVDTHSGSLYVVFKYSDQARSWKDGEGNNDVTLEMCEDFAVRMRAYTDRLRAFVQGQSRAGVRLAGYGAAHRAVVACSVAGFTDQQVRYLVDKNPYLHGFYTPGAHLRIYSPDRLYQDPPDAVIVFASSFEAEVLHEQQAFTQKGGRFISLFPDPRYVV